MMLRMWLPLLKPFKKESDTHTSLKFRNMFVDEILSLWTGDLKCDSTLSGMEGYFNERINRTSFLILVIEIHRKEMDLSLRKVSRKTSLFLIIYLMSYTIASLYSYSISHRLCKLVIIWKSKSHCTNFFD